MEGSCSFKKVKELCHNLKLVFKEAGLTVEIDLNVFPLDGAENSKYFPLGDTLRKSKRHKNNRVITKAPSMRRKHKH
jgi:hypothetical protein